MHDNDANSLTNLVPNKGCVISPTSEITFCHPPEMRDVPREGFVASTTGPEWLN